MGLLQHRFVDEGARRKFVEEASAHAEGQVELVHGKIDAPKLHVGFLKELAADLPGFGEDFFANIQCFNVFEICFVVETKFLVVVADLGEGRSGAQLGF